MPVTAPPDSARPAKAIRLTAIVAGLAGVVLCLLVPLLPVNTSDPSFDWPQRAPASTGTSSVTAPLIAQTPQSLDVAIPCTVLAGLPADVRTVLTTMPPGAQRSAASSLTVAAGPTSVTVTFRNSVAASAARTDLARCSQLRIWSDPAGPGAQFVGLGEPTTLEPIKRPQVVGIFSDLTAEQARTAAAGGLRAHIEIDNRYDSSPSVLKLVVMVLAVLCVAVALVALHLLDGRRRVRTVAAGRRGRVWALLRPRPTDIAVIGVLAVWTVLGAGSPDDGYILGMGKVADSFGYLANYYRWYGIPEAPFDWYYAELGHWSGVSDSILWMHLPQLAAGVVSWLILSRVLLPRLGPAVRRSGWAMWSAATVFAAFWLPFCSGLRSETMIVLGSLVTWRAAERAIATRRMLPAALAAIAAGFTLALAPQGVIGVAILLVSARSMLRIVAARRRTDGWLPVVAPMAAAGLLVLVVIFRDQTLASVAEAIKVRLQVGPVIGWYQEFLRYYFISVSTDDGAMTRRVPLLLLLAGTVVVVAVMLRRTRIRGVDPGPTWRLVGAVGVTLLLFVFTPTKWTIQFGVFAGVGAAIAAVATLAVTQSAARSARNLSVFVAGLLFAMAAATAGKNAWPFAYDYGIAWFDRAPVIAGRPVSSLFLILAVIAAAVAVWQHLRVDYVANKGLSHTAAGDRAGRTRADRVRLFAASSPIAVIAGLLVIAEVLVFAKAAVVRYPAATVFAENLDTLRGRPCGLAERVLAEPDPNAGMLVPTGGRSATQALMGTDPVGFTPNGVPGDLSPEPGSARPGQMNVSSGFNHAFAITGGLGAGTTGGSGPETVNGSTVALPYGLDPATTPVLGSYGYNGEARLTTDWYELPAPDVSPLLVFSAAGAISTVDMFGTRIFGQQILIQFGRPGPDGAFTQIGPDVLPMDPGPILPNQPWRNLRIPRSSAPPAATVMRLALLDNNVGAKQFLAITPPRAPRLQTLQQVVGSTAPTLVDFPVAAHFPCQQPMRVSDGVAQIPRWRILPDYVQANAQSKTWQSAVDGGLLGISESTTSAETVPTYLSGDWYQDWGALERLTPLVPDAAPATVTTDSQTRWGWSRTGSIRLEPSSDDD